MSTERLNLWISTSVSIASWGTRGLLEQHTSHCWDPLSSALSTSCFSVGTEPGRGASERHQSSGSCCLHTPADSHMWMNGQNKEQKWEGRTGHEWRWLDGGGGRVGRGSASQPICSTSLIPKRKGRGRVRRGKRGRATPRQPFYFSVVLQQPLLPWRRKPMIS